MKADAKVVDFAILGTPQTKRNGFKVLGHFTLLLRPMRIEGCSLVVAPNGRFVVWTPDPRGAVGGLGARQRRDQA